MNQYLTVLILLLSIKNEAPMHKITNLCMFLLFDVCSDCMKPHTIISLGGSMISPDAGRIDTDFLALFIQTITSLVNDQQRRFCISLGGGRTCRLYQDALSTVCPNTTHNELDWMGIYTCRYNAQLVRLAFGDLAYEEVVCSFTETIKTDKPIIVVGAEVPGHSSDYDAVKIAELYNAKNIINISNTSYVYSSDPRINPDATRFDRISWEDYLEIIPKEWKPGLSTPFDPIAARGARDHGMSVSLVSGSQTSELIQCLNNQQYKGTIIG